jgi:hypothetical protein
MYIMDKNLGEFRYYPLHAKIYLAEIPFFFADSISGNSYIASTDNMQQLIWISKTKTVKVFLYCHCYTPKSFTAEMGHVQLESSFTVPKG